MSRSRIHRYQLTSEFHVTFSRVAQALWGPGLFAYRNPTTSPSLSRAVYGLVPPRALVITLHHPTVDRQGTPPEPGSQEDPTWLKWIACVVCECCYIISTQLGTRSISYNCLMTVEAK